MKKVFLLIGLSFAFVLSVNVMQSCNPCGDEAIYFQTQAITASAVRITGVDTSGCCDVFKFEDYTPDGKSIRYDSLLIRVESDIQTVFNAYPTVNAFGMNSAYACSPAENYDVFKEVKITSNQPYSSIYPAGTLLNDMVSASWEARVLGSQINNLMINRGNDFGAYYFKFNVAPDSTRIHNITIQYIFMDGRSLKSTIKGLKVGS